MCVPACSVGAMGLAVVLEVAAWGRTSECGTVPSTSVLCHVCARAKAGQEVAEGGRKVGRGFLFGFSFL